MLKVSALPKTPLTVKVINSACSVQKPVLSVQLDLNIYLDAPRATTLSDFLVPFFLLWMANIRKNMNSTLSSYSRRWNT